MRVPTETDEQIEQKSEKLRTSRTKCGWSPHPKNPRKNSHSRRFERRRNSGEWEPNRAGENAYLGAESTRGFVAGSDASAPDLNFFGRTSGRTLRAARWATATGAWSATECTVRGVGEGEAPKGSRGGGKGQDEFISSWPY